MRNYELVFIFMPNESEEQREALLERLKGIVEKDGSVEKVDEWGLRKLAYPINDINEGYYILMNIKSTPESITELERIVKQSNDIIMRHMIIREDE